MLGSLVNMRDLLASSLEDESAEQGMARLNEFSYTLQRLVRGDSQAALDVSAGPISALQDIAASLPGAAGSSAAVSALQTSALYAQDLVRPSRLTLLWPRLVFLPPLALYAAKTAYASRESLYELALEAVETIKGFWEQWLLEPFKDIIKTVRAGGEDGVIVSRESVQADLAVSVNRPLHLMALIYALWTVPRTDGACTSSREAALRPGADGSVVAADPNGRPHAHYAII